MGIRKRPLENLAMKVFNGIYEGKNVLITGHTGFKGSWLALWLCMMKANVTGVALDPEAFPNHWDLLNLSIDDRRLDINNFPQVKDVILNADPEIIFHLAAQPLVRRSYLEPLNTWSTNVIGSANILEACKYCKNVKAVVVISSDKCYKNQEWAWGYRENDPLGGHDPYSASKAALELLVESYRKSFFYDDDSPLIASARAGNVIGGGDWSIDRLIPDLVRSLEHHLPVEIRSPQSVRPWQHVLEALSGYLSLGQRLLERSSSYATAWNFGPEESSNISVGSVLIKLQNMWPDLKWTHMLNENLHEAKLLQLDISKSRKDLDWEPVWNINTSLEKTANWYKSYIYQKILTSSEQISEYIEAARCKNLEWTR